MLTLVPEALWGLISNPSLILTLIVAVSLGLLLGLIPGIGGSLAIALFIPWLAEVDTLTGLVFVIAMHGVIHTAGSIPAILFGIPGTAADAASAVDGLPMTRRGESGRAIGASLCASGVGGVIGAAFLLMMLPVLEPVLLLITPAEYFLLTLLGISFMSAVCGRQWRRGIAVGCLGLCLSFVGLAPQTGEPRFTLGQVFFWDGLDTIALVLALFALPELYALALRGQAAPAHTGAYRTREVLQGMQDVVRSRWLALRTSVIGAMIGFIPGLGGDVASWFCYGHAVQTSSTPERFGRGAVEGVIAPETANNAKEGGALIPTLLFGIPGSSGMAILLVALVVLNVEPGPQLLASRPDLFATLFVVLVLANLLAVALLLLVGPQLARAAALPPSVILPVGLLLVMLGSLLSNGRWEYLCLMVMLSVPGYALRHYQWPRAPFIIGLVLGSRAELSLHQAWSIWGPAFFLRPLSLVLLGLFGVSYLLHLRLQRGRTRSSEPSR